MPELSHPYFEGIKDKLLADTSQPTATRLTDNRIVEDFLPDDPEFPSVRLALVSDLPDQRLAGGDSTTAEVQADVYDHRSEAARAWDIDQAMRSTLDRVNLTVSGFGSVHCMCVQRGRSVPEGNYYRILSRYRLFGSSA